MRLVGFIIIILLLLLLLLLLFYVIISPTCLGCDVSYYHNIFYIEGYMNYRL